MSTTPTPVPANITAAQLGELLYKAMKATSDDHNTALVNQYNAAVAFSAAQGQKPPNPPILTSISENLVVSDEQAANGNYDGIDWTAVTSYYQYVPPPPPPPPPTATSLVGFSEGSDSTGTEFWSATALASSQLSDGQSYSDPQGRGTFTFHKKPYLVSGVFSVWFTKP